MKKQIPNILSIARLLLVPVFICFFLRDRHLAAWITFAVANLTDVADGYLARKHGWITDTGKILDPLADKLLQISAAVCLATADGVYIILAVLLTAKELCMLIGGTLIMRKHKIKVVSAWYGKAATVIYFFTVSAFILFMPPAPYNLILTLTLCAVFITALLLYYFLMFKRQFGMNTEAEVPEE